MSLFDLVFNESSDDDLRRAFRAVAKNPGDADAREHLASVQARIGDTNSAAENRHVAALLRDPRAHATELRSRVEQGRLDPQTLRHYREALHRAYPSVANRIRNWVDYDEQARAIRHQLNIRPRVAWHDVGWEDLYREHGMREGEAVHELDEALHKMRNEGHNMAHFLEPPVVGEPGHDTTDLVQNHLSRLHRLLNGGEQGDASFGENSIHHHHYFDQHGGSPGATRAHANRHAALIRENFPNAQIAVRPESPGPGIHEVALTNLRELRPA